MKENIVIKVEKNSIAEELGIEVGDALISINDKPVVDIFDYRYLIQEEYLEVLIRKPDTGTEEKEELEWLLEIEKEENEDLGIVFELGLMDEAKSCKNKCIFCFIDQLPENMRDTLYFKDDDSRLSFLQGNYVTLTNMDEKALDRIIFYHLSPINISVHTTDLPLRKYMLKNPNSDNIIKYIDKISNEGIDMNFQIVLVKGINDTFNLDKSIEDLSKFIPSGKSLSVVPVGITKYRENLFPLSQFTKEDALNIINQIETWQSKLKKEYGTSFVFAADEFYLLAESEMPNHKAYEDFPQIENGVGMISLMEHEFNKKIKKVKYTGKPKTISIATGTAAYSFIKKISNVIEQTFPDITVNVYEIKNNFFGNMITVSGLLTAGDIIEQLNNKDLGEYLLIPKNALKASSNIFLDDLEITDIEENLKIKILAVEANGEEFINKILLPL